MRVRADRGIRRLGQVVAEERRATGQLAGTQDRARGRVRHGLVAAGELDDHPAARHERRIGGRVGGLLRPLASGRSASGSRMRRAPCRPGSARSRSGMFSLKLSSPAFGGARCRGSGVRVSSDKPTRIRKLGDRRAISMIGPPGTFGTPARMSGSSAEQRHAVDAAERLAGVVDPRRAQVGGSVPVDVDSGLEHLHELHQVDRGLAQAVAVADQRVRRRGVHALGRVDRAVAVLVDRRGRRAAASRAAGRRG